MEGGGIRRAGCATEEFRRFEGEVAGAGAGRGGLGRIWISEGAWFA